MVIVSTRTVNKDGETAIKQWLDKYGIVVDGVQKEKPPAVMYIDDRAINFNGNCQTLMRDIKKFKCWTEKARKVYPYCHKEFFDDYKNNRNYCSIACRIASNIEKVEEQKDANI